MLKVSSAGRNPFFQDSAYTGFLPANGGCPRVKGFCRAGTSAEVTSRADWQTRRGIRAALLE